VSRSVSPPSPCAYSPGPALDRSTNRFSHAIIRRVAELTRRKLLAGSVPVLGAGAAILHSTVPHGHPWEAEAAAQQHEGHGSDGGHAAFRDGRTVDHTANGFDPHELVRDFDWGTTRRTASGRVVREWE